MEINLFSLLGIFCFVSIYFGKIREFVIFRIRLTFWRDKDRTVFFALPSHDIMVFHPRYQHLWTKAQWIKWVKAQGVTK